VAKNSCVKAREVKKPPKAWEAKIGGSKAIALLLVARPYATKFRDRIEEILKRYRERPTRRIE
jgi:hypothetical protein